MVEQKSQQKGEQTQRSDWSLIINLPQNCEKDDEDTGGISIHNIGGVFIVIFCGIVLAMITLAVEYWYYKHKTGPKTAKVGAAETKKVAEYDKKTEQKGENKW